ncbi:hypothetical protein G6N05_15155 [Flavobacterium sp. F372]|uniref:DUF4468 domain-containing protein n=1 Tax=Flavobacterium bernardetii TaxID=2813823 RepID=A0ABR7J304_9FLAO|nr:hypothetical protein [Flavobacterium bernardetii]MBC5836224.1 hypothetical protein [Flavobacterium bernardetii]NHF71450.1 hypothetical protein [Flavobacterium bernardetii]
MKTKILILFLLFSSLVNSQSLDDTIDWITRNSNGSEQVKYDVKTKKLLLISVRKAGNRISSLVKEINPNDVNSISISSSNNWNSVVINFKKGGSYINSYIVSENINEKSNEGKIKMYGIEISFEVDKIQIQKFKKAYINLLKEIGVKVIDGDLF